MKLLKEFGCAFLFLSTLFIFSCTGGNEDYDVSMVEGWVENRSNIGDFDIFIYQPADWENKNEEELKNGFSGAITSAEIYQNNFYRLSYLAEGKYLIVIVTYDDEGNATLVKTIENVEVPMNMTIPLNLEIPPASSE